ncbi:MAG: hypothetical protein ABEJ42_03315 [Halobacteriaceae archaeon]
MERRALLAGAGVALTLDLAGCSKSPPDGGSGRDYEDHTMDVDTTTAPGDGSAGDRR